MNSKSVAFSIALILAFVDFGSCIKCYHCDSQKDSKCGTTLTSNVMAMDCSSPNSTTYVETLMPLLPREIFTGTGPKFCYKIVLGSDTVVRSCLDGTKDMDATCKTILEGTKNSASAGYRVKQCFACDKDSCNGAGSLSVSLPLSLVAFVVSYLLYKQ